MVTSASKIMQLSMVCLCLVAWCLKATGLHIVPLWYVKETKSWEVLVSRNAGTAFWTDFYNTGTADPILLAQSTIKSFTRGRYNESNAPISGAFSVIQSDQHYWFTPVLQRLDDKVMRKARNCKKSDFTWVPAQVLAGYSQVYDRRKRKSGCITVEPNFREAFRILWPGVEKKLQENSTAVKACAVKP